METFLKSKNGQSAQEGEQIMAKRITQEEFSKRLLDNNPDAKFEILEYEAISKPVKIKCLKCGKTHEYKKGNAALSAVFCCELVDRLNSIKTRLENTDYKFIKKVDKDNIVIKHLICGNEQTRSIYSAYKQPCSCKFCGSGKLRNMISIEEIQQRLDKDFNGEISILEYNGQLEKNKYRCNKCGFIFIKDDISMHASKGCPKCNANHSKGERYLENLLKQYNINYKVQVAFKELPLQHFDFGIYDDNNELKCLIEVQGEQHFKKVEIFKDSLEIIQYRDNKKRTFCQQNNISLYELTYIKGKIKNLEILNFLFNDYPQKEE